MLVFISRFLHVSGIHQEYSIASAVIRIIYERFFIFLIYLLHAPSQQWYYMLSYYTNLYTFLTYIGLLCIYNYPRLSNGIELTNRLEDL
jgi:hypothetical protein